MIYKPMPITFQDKYDRHWQQHQGETLLNIYGIISL
jgi:hypothetical protein